MKKKTRKVPGVVAAALLLAVIMVASSTAAAATGVNILSEMNGKESVHGKIDISDITGEIAEPPQLTSAASAIAAEKKWYEYVYYSPESVAYYYLNDNTRLAFYDPYDYSESLIMEVDDSLTDWSSNNSMQISYTTGNSITDTKGKSTETVSTTNYGYTDIETTETGPSTVKTTTDNKTESYNTSKTVSIVDNYDWGLNETIHDNASSETTLELPLIGKETITIEAGLDVSSSQHWTDGTTTTTVEGDKKGDDGGSRTGYTTSHNEVTVENSAQTKTITKQIADRTSLALGKSTNSSIALSTNNSLTITKTYDAGYFNASGAPLQWKIVKYTVKMPMKYQVEYLVDDEWIFGNYSYCLLTTIQGTCRAWLQNNVAYYEHWGTGEPVTWDEFWVQFFTEDSLIAAYKNKLYPEMYTTATEKVTTEQTGND
ncbi:MAG: hypothetical protein IJS65_07790 [Clostridia bacterium]|nr:hypothetical protein [Clostridia bacterium]